jgi:hypothetical protein
MKSRDTWQRTLHTQVGLWHKFSTLDVESFIADRMIGFDEDGEPHSTWDPDQAKALRQATAAATKTLLYAEPFFVAGEMCDLVEVAAASFTPEPLLLTDFLTPCGFLMFERDVEVWHGVVGDQVRLPYAAFAWIGVTRSEGADPAMMAFTTYTGEPWRVQDGLPAIHELEAWELGAKPPRRAEGWARLVQTTLRLMLEFKPARRESLRPDRATRRAARRAGFQERDVVVVRLRRERTPSEQLGGTANYSCRFMVSGHWRNQWHPSTGQHRQTWVSPYVKGPADKPFKPKRGRAFTFFR